MFEYFRFSLPLAVTQQLIERLDTLEVSPLNDDAIIQLTRFQAENRSAQGVYVIYLNGGATYAGKADFLAERLFAHFRKLTGRRGIEMGAVAFKALLLDENWSTSANEELLIEHFKNRNECQWNGAGFGPKDPGRIRDGGAPNWFDRNYPVREDFPIANVPDDTTVSALLTEIKAQVPYLFRYDIETPEVGVTPLALAGITRNAQALLVQAARALGDSWQLMLFAHGFTLYRAQTHYPNGTQLFP